jgi:hypothetical protein
LLLEAEHDEHDDDEETKTDLAEARNGKKVQVSQSQTQKTEVPGDSI